MDKLDSLCIKVWHYTALPNQQHLCYKVKSMQSWQRLHTAADPSHLSPDASSVVKVVFVIRQLPDAVVDGNAALARSQVFLRHLHPAQGAHCKTLTPQTRSTSAQTVTNKAKRCWVVFSFWLNSEATFIPRVTWCQFRTKAIPETNKTKLQQS